MRVVLTGHGFLAEEYLKANPSAVAYSFRGFSDEGIANAVKSTDVLIHNAANNKVDGYEDAMISNFLLTKRIVDIVKRVNPDMRFINISSITATAYYLSPYAMSKLCAESYCHVNLRNCASLRFSTIFYGGRGKDNLSKMIIAAIEQGAVTLFNNGRDTKDWFPGEMAVKYLQEFIDSDRCGINNICSGICVPIKEFCEKYIIPKTQARMVLLEEEFSKNNHYDTNGLPLLELFPFLLEDYTDKFIEEIYGSRSL